MPSEHHITAPCPHPSSTPTTPRTRHPGCRRRHGAEGAAHPGVRRGGGGGAWPTRRRASQPQQPQQTAAQQVVAVVAVGVALPAGVGAGPCRGDVDEQLVHWWRGGQHMGGAAGQAAEGRGRAARRTHNREPGASDVMTLGVWSGDREAAGGQVVRWPCRRASWKADGTAALRHPCYALGGWPLNYACSQTLSAEPRCHPLPSSLRLPVFTSRLPVVTDPVDLSNPSTPFTTPRPPSPLPHLLQKPGSASGPRLSMSGVAEAVADSARLASLRKCSGDWRT